ncbi:MAG TPA: c-type cytochrome [Gemmatimonadaceae bacterium]|nr:c-type cytochrome [Gemmatimonadaceae bacterium]
MKRWALLCVVLLAACGEAQRHRTATVDTAAALPYDTSFAPAVPDTVDTTGLPRTDSLAATLSPVPAGPTVVLLADSAIGDSIFHRTGRCFTCHGRRAEGIAGLGPSLSDSTWLHGDGSLASITQAITDGIASPVAASITMPAFGGQLAPTDIHRVASYVYSLSHPGAAVADTMPRDSVRGDTMRVPGTSPDSTATPGAPQRDTGALVP